MEFQSEKTSVNQRPAAVAGLDYKVALVEASESELTFAKECYELLKKHQVSRIRLNYNESEIKLQMSVFHELTSEWCGTACCIAGFHFHDRMSRGLIPADDKYIDFDKYMSAIGINYLSDSCVFLADAGWFSNIDYALTRLKFVVDTGLAIKLAIDDHGYINVYVSNDKKQLFKEFTQAEFHQILIPEVRKHQLEID